MLVFDLPLPPSANSLWKPRAKSGLRKSEAYIRWQRIAAKIVYDQVREENPITGRYDLGLILADEIRGDADNRIKAANDLLQVTRIIDNDKNCRNIKLRRSKALPADRCLVTVTPLNETN